MDSRRTVLYFLKQEEKDEVEEIQFGLGKNLQMFASPKWVFYLKCCTLLWHKWMRNTKSIRQGGVVVWIINKGLLIQFKKFFWPTKSYVWIMLFLAHMEPSYKEENKHSFLRPLYLCLLGNLFTVFLEQDIFLSWRAREVSAAMVLWMVAWWVAWPKPLLIRLRLCL